MQLIPAIDLKNGQCVRLKQGVMEQATIFSDSPAQTAQHWLEQGARRLHLVDLDGAFAGEPKNFSAISAILSAVSAQIPVQLGGGIRDLKTIEKYLDLGLNNVIIGTAAVKNPALVREACREFAGHIIVGLDAKEGMVAIDGWSTITEYHEDYGVNNIIYTDIGRDGMMNGINIPATINLARAVQIPIIASGGLSNLDDIRTLCSVQQEGITGAITGRAIYEGSLNFAQAQQLADSLVTA